MFAGGRDQPGVTSATSDQPDLASSCSCFDLMAVYCAVPPSHLYIHVPFCARRCSYCDFSIAVRSTTPVDEYLNALAIEARQVIQESCALDTVYLGGGTPSRLGGNGIARLLATIRDRARINPRAELTIEVNPDDVTAETAQAWVDAGINRISLGVQSFDDGVLGWMHRVHTAAQSRAAVQILRHQGIANVSVDLIFNLPKHLDRSWESDINQALDLEPTHVSLYGLTVEHHTTIARWADRGAIVEGTDSQYEEEFLYAHTTMAAAGFDHYEVSNFAQPGHRSRHNSAYWTGAPYAALGPSAHSFDGAFRRWNVSAYADWTRRLVRGEAVMAGEEMLTAENKEAENVYLGLRTRTGLRLHGGEAATVQPWVEAGWAELEGTHLTLTPSGWLRLDSLAATLAAGRDNRVMSTLSTTPSHCYI